MIIVRAGGKCKGIRRSQDFHVNDVDGQSGGQQQRGLGRVGLALGLLGGMKAADFPVTTARHGQSMLNRQTARKLGIDVPESVFKRMDLILEGNNGNEKEGP